MTRYTRAEREEAALICAIAASNCADQPYVFIQSALTGELPTFQGCTKAVDLAAKAWGIVRAAYGHTWTREVDAEAECLIRNNEI